MNVSLSPELEKLVERKIASGMYQTASEVVREGLRMIAERDELSELRREQLRADVRKGMESLDAGKGIAVSDPAALAREIKTRGRSRLGARKKGGA